jgi:spore maturation protein SpmB
VLNYIWLALVVRAVAIGGWNDRLNEVTAGAFDGAKAAVTIALGLIGVYGSTETTFYVEAVYFGSVGVKQTRHAIPAGLLGDLAGVIPSVTICRAVFRSHSRSCSCS